MERIRIEGAKLSQELITINLRYPAYIDKNLSRFYTYLSDYQINILFLSTLCEDKNYQVTCCVDSEAGDIIHSLIKSETDFSSHAEIIEQTGLLTLFPHHFNLKILGLVLDIIGKSSFPLYGATSSLSSLTFILDFCDLDRAVDHLREKIEIAADKIERRPKIQIKQSRLIKKEDL